MLILSCVIEGHLKLRHILYYTLYVLMLPSKNKVIIIIIMDGFLKTLLCVLLGSFHFF